MPGALRIPLAEALQLIQRQIVSREMQHGIKQHGSMPGGKHKAIPVRPLRIAGIVPQVTLPKHIGYRRNAMGVPGWPLLAFCTASMASVRIVFMLSWSSLLSSSPFNSVLGAVMEVALIRISAAG